MASKRVLSVGQCHLDEPAIARTIRQHFTAEVIGVPTAEKALEELRQGGYSVVLVNRIFDVNGGSGIGLIEKVKSDPDLQATPIMLVSNYPDWQEKAAKIGGVPGFGKAEMGQPSMLNALRPFLG